MSKVRTILLLLLVSALFSTIAAQTTNNYEPGRDSKLQPGVPKGEILKFSFDSSKIFPGTTREYWVYVPAQYTPAKPACVFVGQDGIKFEAPTVFDNLIHKNEMPVTIGVFVMHGRVNAANPDSALDRFNRSYEYDGLGDNYARFLLEELLPEVETKKTADGRAIRLSHNGNDRAIGGLSSGAIAAFTAAWERPVEFSRVFSAIGTYVGLRGGDIYPTLIRRFEPKPIRIFLQDGSNDLNIYAGDWWMENQTMERALTFAGYEVQHVWGDGGHNDKQPTAVFPDAMRWLWKDYPASVKTGVSKNAALKEILIPGEGWQLVSEGYKFSEGPATNANGEVFFNDVPDNKTYKIGLDGKVTVFNPDSKRADGQAFGPDGRLYAVATNTRQILAYDADGKAKIVAEGFIGNDIVVANNGNTYVTNPPQGSSTEPSRIWLIRPNGEKTLVDTGLNFSNGITLSPDQTLLYVADSRSHWVYSYAIQPDGMLRQKQRFYWLHSPDTLDWSGADGLRVDSDGRLYIATALGIQIADQMGRVQCIIPTPNGRVANFTFGGKDRDTLFVMSADKIYKRKLKVRGALAWDKPVKPTQPSL
ncbi:MAG TPA: gluconolactonase [Blastocatellia bacterium]|jgi:sugar lactone lactonase YvrE/enterochelin esterase-like enzyme|nr:gluconolactonase [Blastocatellia bacterium]